MSSLALAALGSWRFDPPLTLAFALTAALYARGWRRVRGQHRGRFPPWRFAAFVAGLGIAYVAAASPLDAFAGLLLQVHMAQHLLLMGVAPPLLLMGAPAVPLLRGLPPGLAREVVGPIVAAPEVRRIGDVLSHPLAGLLAMSAATWFWHAPGPYQRALVSPLWHGIEHLCFLAGGLLFWWPVVQPWPSRPRWPAWALPLYLLAADLQNTALAAILVFSERVLYPIYSDAPRIAGGSALDDQVAAGLLMWVPMSLLYLVPAAVLTVRLLSPAGARSRAERGVRAEPERRLEPHSRFDLLAVPGVGRWLRSLRARRLAQGAMLVLAAVVVADGLLGPQMSPMNLAGVLPWTYWRGFTVVALLALGNLFCMVCPFTLPRELARWAGIGGREWPKQLRSKWLAVALLLGFFALYEIGGVWDDPRATALLIAGYFAAAFAVDVLFRGASFCKWVCPIGQFHFVQSLVSPLEVAVRQPSACAGCTTHDCLRGNQRQRGCELELFLPRKAGGLDCTVCLDCVRACPRDNIGLLAVTPGRELWRDPERSSLGRLSQRIDVAVLALVLVFGALATAAAMVAPVTRSTAALAAWLGLSESWIIAAGLLVATVALPVAALSLSAAVARGRGAASAREVFCRLSLALVPLGLALWTAHFVFHLLTGWWSLSPVLRRWASDTLGWRLGEPTWAMPPPLLSLASVLQIEVLMLDAGLLLALYAGWRVAAGSGRGAMAALLPWSLVALGLWAGGVWVFLQPMEMRGMVH